MAKIYSIIARRFIDVPDRKPGVAAVVTDIETGSSKVAQQLTGWLLEAEKKITDLEAKLTTETAARKTADTEAASAARARAITEGKVTALGADLEKARAAAEKELSDGRVALAKAEGATALERAARATAEQRATAAEQRIKQVEAAPKPVIQSGPDLKQITSAIRAELGACPAAKPVQLPFEVDITERDGNGRIKRFKPRFTS